MYATNADVPPDVQDRFSARCLTVWRETWNDTMTRHGDEGRAFATAELAGQNCTAATKSAHVTMPDSADAMRQHLGDAPPDGHGMTSMADMTMAQMQARHASMHDAGSGHDHQMTKSAGELAAARAVKFVGSDTIEGPVFLYDYVDTDAEHFTAKTDYCLEWFGKSGRPVLYEHGLDSDLKTDVIGRQVNYDIRAEGIWAQSELNRHVRYRKAIDRLIEQGAIGYSAGAMQHLARKSADGGITRFPWVELSMTPTPAAPGNLGIHYVKSADALAHFEAVGYDLPGPLKAALAALDEWAISRDDDSLPDGLKFADLVDRLSVDGPAWVRARRDWYAKSGRVLSAATRERLATHPQALRQLADDLDELLASADAPKDGKSALTGLLELERLRAEMLGVEVPPIA